MATKSTQQVGVAMGDDYELVSYGDTGMEVVEGPIGAAEEEIREDIGAGWEVVAIRVAGGYKLDPLTDAELIALAEPKLRATQAQARQMNDQAEAETRRKEENVKAALQRKQDDARRELDEIRCREDAKRREEDNAREDVRRERAATIRYWVGFHQSKLGRHSHFLVKQSAGRQGKLAFNGGTRITDEQILDIHRGVVYRAWSAAERAQGTAEADYYYHLAKVQQKRFDESGGVNGATFDYA